MNPEAILALLSDLYIQTSALQARVRELEAALLAAQEPKADGTG